MLESSASACLVQERVLTVATANGSVVLTFRFWTEAGQWVVECVELGRSTFGRTLNRTHDELKELVLLHLTTLEAISERDHFFRKQGIRVYVDAPPAEVQSSMPVDGEVYTHVHQFPVAVPA